MKTLIASFLFLLVSNFVFGQIEWVGNHDFSEAATDIVRTSQGQYILVHGNGSGLTVLDNNGVIVFEKLLNVYQNDNYQRISDIIELSDSSIVFTSSVVDCDVFISNFYKFDKSWNELASFYLYDAEGPAARFSDDAVIFSEKGYNRLVKLDNSGAQQWETNLNGNNINDLVITADDTLLIASEQGLIKLSASGAFVESLPNLVFDRLEILSNGNFLAQFNDVLYLYDQDLTQLSFFQQQGEAIVDLAIGQNEIAVLTSALKIVRLDIGLNQTDMTVLTGQNQSFSSVAFADNGYMVGGGEQYGNDDPQNESAFIKQLALNGSTANTAKDAALTSVQLVGSPTTVINLWGFYYEAIVHGLQVTVENAGTTTINQLNVNFHHNTTVFLWECAELQTFSKSFDDLNLQPGASMVLDWGDQSLLFNENPAGKDIELCMWTSLPDHQLETNNDNDVSCTEVLVAAHEPFPISFSHAFNPVADVLYLEMQTDVDYSVAKATIFNVAGQMVYAEPITDQFQNLDLSYLTDGAYFLQIVSGERVGWGKFAKY
ncbi:MAG: T9SS type A sorting domain-containing protein [Saprospiraceae bacterium]|nr:T9SS type A sorting domain-containing protein [Saprospiraceae bacterium]